MIDPGQLFWSAQESVRFALGCLEPVGEHLRARSSFVDPEGRPMHWHNFGDLEGPGWAANAVGGAHLLWRWSVFTRDAVIQRQALQLLDHVLEDGFLQPDGLILPYFDLQQNFFCLNYNHRDDWLCPGSLAKVGVQMLDLARDLQTIDPSRTSKLRQAAQQLATWLERKVPLLPSGWAPRRITADGEAYALSPSGGRDPIFDHSGDNLFLLQLWALTGKKGLAGQLGDAFVEAGGLWGSINHDTFDDQENVAYAVAFRVLRQAARLLERPGWVQWAYDFALPAMRRFRMDRDEHGVATRGLFWMEASWDTAYLWENAEVAQAYLEAWQERGDRSHLETALDILAAISKHHYGPLGFLSEGIDWNNHNSQRHHIHRDYYGAIRYTEPLLNNLHLVLPTLTYLEAAGYRPKEGSIPSSVPANFGKRKEEIRARYLLRLYHPALESDESVASVLQFARSAGVDGVLLFEANFDTDPALLTLEVLQKRFARLKEILPRFREAGLEVHINVMITMGHVDAGGGRPDRFAFQFQVNDQGQSSRSSACPLDPAYLDYAGQIYRWAAECGADAVWVDDDTRFVYHDLPGMNCFCPLHLAEMARRTGKAFRREDLVITLQEDVADPRFRRAWFHLQEEAMLQFAARVEHEVHSIDPRQAVGLMTIGTIPHAAEGRHADRLLRTLSGRENQPMIRPGSGFWSDWEPAAVIAKTEDVARQVHFLGRDVRVVAEIENHPYTPYAKSLRILFLELALNILAGAPDLSLNILNSTAGLNPEYTLHAGFDYAAFLNQKRPFLDALVEARSSKIRQGIGVEASEEIARQMPLGGRPLSAWLEPRPWELILARLGLPVGLPQEAPHLLAGDIIHTIDPASLESILQDGVVLTPLAVNGLLEKGWGERIGVRSVGPAVPGVNEYFMADPLNGRHSAARLQVRHYAQLFAPHTYQFIDENSTRVLSRWVDVDGVDRGAAAAALERGDGIRLGLLPFDLQTPAHPILQLARREQWASLFEWVGRKALPCRITKGVNLFPQVFVDPHSGEALLIVTNLSADDADFQYEMPILPGSRAPQWLSENGTWSEHESLNHARVKAWSMAVLKW